MRQGELPVGERKEFSQVPIQRPPTRPQKRGRDCEANCDRYDTGYGNEGKGAVVATMEGEKDAGQSSQVRVEHGTLAWLESGQDKHILCLYYEAWNP